MNRDVVARLLRLLLVAGWTAVVFVPVVLLLDPVAGEGPRLLLPFLAAGLAASGLVAVRAPVDRLVERITDHRLTTPYSVLARTTARVGAGSLEQALPGLAQVLAEGTGAQRAVIWLVVEGRLVEAATFPPDHTPPDVVDNLGVLLARPDTDHVVPVLDGTVLRAALAVDKADAAVTPADRRLVQDVADGAGLLLRSVQRGAELAERVRQADELAEQLRESRMRLTGAREVERRRLIGELSHATTGRLDALHDALGTAAAALGRGPGGTGGDAAAPGDDPGPGAPGDDPDPGTPANDPDPAASLRDPDPGVPADPAAAGVALRRARAALDELLARFRVIARGVYPAVLRDQGPIAALDEVLADLPRQVVLTGTVEQRLAWEVESGVYYLAAAAMTHLGGPADTELHVHLEHRDGRLSVRVDDPELGAGAAAALQAELAGDIERLAALGGDVEVAEYAAGVTVVAWLPERLGPLVGAATPGAGP